MSSLLPRIKGPYPANNNLQKKFWYTPLLPLAYFWPISTRLCVREVVFTRDPCFPGTWQYISDICQHILNTEKVGALCSANIGSWLYSVFTACLPGRCYMFLPGTLHIQFALSGLGNILADMLSNCLVQPHNCMILQHTLHSSSCLCNTNQAGNQL